EVAVGKLAAKEHTRDRTDGERVEDQGYLPLREIEVVLTYVHVQKWQPRAIDQQLEKHHYAEFGTGRRIHRIARGRSKLFGLVHRRAADRAAGNETNLPSSTASCHQALPVRKPNRPFPPGLNRAVGSHGHEHARNSWRGSTASRAEQSQNPV